MMLSKRIATVLVAAVLATGAGTSVAVAVAGSDDAASSARQGSDDPAGHDAGDDD